MAIDYEYMLDAIKEYYGPYNSTIWQKINLGQASYDEISFAFSQIPQRQLLIDTALDGSHLGYSYADPIYLQKLQDDVNQILGNANSNLDVPDYGDNAFTSYIPGSWSGGGGSDYNVNSGAISGASGAGNTVMAVADRLSLAVTGINIGAKLGRKIDETIYNIDPNWWDTHYPSINPETWKGLAGGSQAGQSFIRTIFGIKDNQMVSYIDEDVIAYTYKLLHDNGLFDNGCQLSGQQIEPNITIENPQYITGTVAELAQTLYNIRIDSSHSAYNQTAIAIMDPFGNVGICSCNLDLLPTELHITTQSGNTFYFTEHTNITSPTWYKPDYTTGTIIWGGGSSGEIASVTNSLTNTGSVSIILGEPIENPTVPQTGSTQIDPSLITGNTIPQIKQQLKENYPDLFTDPIHEDVLQPDGTIKTKTYYPVPWGSTSTKPDEKTQSQTQPTTNTKTNQQSDIYVDPQTMTDILNKPDVTPPDNTSPNVPETGTGESPTFTPVVGNASSLWAIYNPTQTQLNDFGAWLWDSNFIEQIKKLFNDPMQAIIGVHKVFATPSTGSPQNIKCGYIESNVASKIVTNQYATVDCGTVSLAEYFGNVFDYDPYTSVKVFLPFIGIVPLNVSDIMRSKISIKYTVDVLTGACIAEISVKRDGNKSVLYTYSGSAIVTYPISSGSYAGVVSGVLSVTAGLVGTALSGGAMLPAVMGGASALMHSKANTTINGQFTGSAGAMGGKTPYLIITRPITRIANDANTFNGYPSNYTTKIGNCHGFIKITDIHLCVNNAYKSELDEIDVLLRNGVLTHGVKPVEQSETISPIHPIKITRNGIYNAYGDIMGYDPVTVDVHPDLQEKTVYENGVILPDTGYEGLSKVTVLVEAGGQVYTNAVYTNQEQVDTSNFTNIYATNKPYGNNGAKVNSRLNVTDETDIANLQAGGWNANGMCFYDSENQIGAYAGYTFGEALRLTKAKFWLNRYSGQNTILTATAQYLDENNHWIDIEDMLISTSLQYPSYVFEITLNPNIDMYGIRWIHYKAPNKTVSNNITFAGMTIYAPSGNPINVYMTSQRGYIEPPLGFDGFGPLLIN